MNSRIRGFGDLKNSLGPSFLAQTETNSKQKEETDNMTTQDNYSPNNTDFFTSRVSHYNHNRRFGFVHVDIPAGTELTFDIKNKELLNKVEGKEDTDTIYNSGGTLENDVTIEAFIHASVVSSAGYEMGLEDGQEVFVRVARQARDQEKQKGLQVYKVKSLNNNTNEKRLANEFLEFVPATVKMYNGAFGFVSIENHYKSGEKLSTPIDAYFNKHILKNAEYKDENGEPHINVGDKIIVKYFTYSNKKSSVTLIKYKDLATAELEKNNR